MEIHLSESDSNTLRDLGRLEGQIGSALESFAVAGLALWDIRDNAAWREDYATFKDYCRHRWSLSLERVNWLIEAGACMDRIYASQHDKSYPIHESQVAPLLLLPGEERVATWLEASRNTQGGQPTEETVRMAVATRLPPDEHCMDDEALAIQAQFAERLDMVLESHPLTLKAIAELLECSRGEARAFVMMCEVSPSVIVSRIEDGCTEYEFEATHCVLGRDRIRQLASHITQEDGASANSLECATRILHLLGDLP